jgi:hypothetical protein
MTAVKFGHFVQDAYSLLSVPDPDGFVLTEPGYMIANILYADDLLADLPGYITYGFIARSTAAPPYDVVIAIRGTEGIFEWMDNAVFEHQDCPFWPNGPKTEDGFTNIYKTLGTAPSLAGQPATAALNSLVTLLGAASVGAVTVCGHSLGGALATLLIGDIVAKAIWSRPSVYTFASPAVGDEAFANAFNAEVPQSWRIYNKPDIVPMLPPPLLGYAHVETPYEIDSSSSTKKSIICWHSMETYLHMLDNSEPLDADCVLGGASVTGTAPVASTSAPS